MKARYKDVLKRAAEDEMMRQVEEWGQKYNVDMYSNILWTLHDELGLGRERLTKVFKALSRNYDKFRREYDFEDTYAERYKLREECGLDVEKLMQEEGLI